MDLSVVGFLVVGVSAMDKKLLDLAFFCRLSIIGCLPCAVCSILDNTVGLVLVLKSMLLLRMGDTRNMFQSRHLGARLKNEIIPPISYGEMENFDHLRRVMRELQIASWSFCAVNATAMIPVLKQILSDGLVKWLDSLPNYSRLLYT